MSNNTPPTTDNYTVYYETPNIHPARDNDWTHVPCEGIREIPLYKDDAKYKGRPILIPVYMLDSGAALRIRIVPTDVGTIKQSQRAAREAALRGAGKYYTKTRRINDVQFVEIGKRGV